METELRTNGRKIVTIQDPHIHRDTNYDHFNFIVAFEKTDYD
jgi:hypothetical protein